MTIHVNETSTQSASTSPPSLSRAAITLSVVALLVSGLSLAAWAVERPQLENRLACLELPGPNDCGIDGE